MRDLINELCIKYHLWRMCNTHGAVQKSHMHSMYACIAKRSPQQVKRMEKGRVI